MRIIHVLCSQGYGGSESHALVLMKGQIAAGHEVFFAGRSNCWLSQACRSQGIPVLPLRMRGKHDVASILKLRWHASHWKADILHGHSERGGRYTSLAGLLGTKFATICTAHSDSDNKDLDRNRHIIAVSEAIAHNLEAHGFSANKITMIYNGMPDEPIGDREMLRQELEIPEGTYAVVHVGRFSYTKGQDLLLRAFEDCPPEMQLYLIGDYCTPFGKQIQTLAQEKTNIHLLGYRGDVQRLLPAFDAYALSSRREALGLSIIEASAASLPIVATSVGGVPEVVVHGQTGILVPQEQPVALTRGLMELYKHPELACRLGKAARARYLEKFTVNGMVQSTLNVYSRCLA